MDVDSYIPGTRIEFIAVLATTGLYGITCMQTYEPSLLAAIYKYSDRVVLSY